MITYTTRLITASLSPDKSKSLKSNLIAIGLFEPCTILILLMRNGSNGGIAKPECPFGCDCTICVITFGRHATSAALHCGKSLAVIKEQEETKNLNYVSISNEIHF